MRAFKRVFRAVPMVGILAEYPETQSKVVSDRDVNLWADSVGEALGQVGLVATLAVVARFAIGLLSDLVAVL